MPHVAACERSRRSSRHGLKGSRRHSPLSTVAPGAIRSRSAVRCNAGPATASTTPRGHGPRAGAGEVSPRTALRPAPSRQGRAGVRPHSTTPPARRSAGLRAGRIKATELRELANGALRVKRPESSLEHLHRKRPEALGRGLRMGPHSPKCPVGCLGIAGEVPRCGEGHEAFDGDKICGGDRHRAAEAIADQRDRLADAAQQRQQQFLDMAGDAKLRSLVRLSPIEQQGRLPSLRSRRSTTLAHRDRVFAAG